MGWMNKERVNIVLSHHTLRYAYQKNPTDEGLVSYGELELPDGVMEDGQILDEDAFQDLLDGLVRENRWKRKKLFFAVPDDTVVMREIQIPSSLTEEEAYGYVKTQVGHGIYLPFPDPSIALQFLEVQEEQEERDVLLFAYPKEKIAAFEKVFQKAGFKPAAADLTSLSVYRYFYHHRNSMQSEKEHVLLVNWNRDALVLTAFRHHQAIFSRNMKMDSDIQDVNGEQEMAQLEEHLLEINRILDFYHFSISKGEAAIQQLLLTGDFPLLAEVEKRLSDTTALPIENFAQEEMPARYISVLGLSLKKDA
ncbi:type IV pilus biogenesis protein PilM [Virgibacillus xinjiangensis]|uniref:Type IV pilus biogenesis protein PilM n=1 Tax=Virgibacillus xinjiangensis TaxID=393090 RepID=A0ABV7CUS6_9BACI